MEKLVNKEHKAILEKFIVKPQGKPTLAPEDDKRPTITATAVAEEAFGGDNTYTPDGSPRILRTVPFSARLPLPGCQAEAEAS